MSSGQTVPTGGEVEEIQGLRGCGDGRYCSGGLRSLIYVGSELEY